MYTPLGIASLTLGLLVTLACGSTDTELGAAFEPLNGAACGPAAEEHGDCQCAADGRWLCAGQNSVTCNSIYGSGGGRLLVNADAPCEMQWGWQQGCSDGRTYGIQCDGLRCTCSVDGSLGKSWFTPRCGEMVEANAQCGWSLKLPDGASMGNAPAQGHACEELGAHDDATDCTCMRAGWDCQDVAGCRISDDWAGAEGTLAIAPYGTALFAGAPGVDRFDILAQSGPGFLATWQLAPPYVFFRSTHSPSEPSCDDTFGQYALAFDAACGALSLTLVEDPCAVRVAALDGFRGVR